MDIDDIRAQLKQLADPEYRKFNASLIPSVHPDRVIGVRMPALRALAREIATQPTIVAELLETYEHDSLEEEHLHGLSQATTTST